MRLPHPPRAKTIARRWVAMLALVVIAAACGDDDEIIARSEQPPPPRDAVLADGGWPEAAAWIQRENEAGRPVLVNIFASWCLPCRREMPMLLDAAKEHPDIAFLGIDHLDQRANAEAFVEEMGISFATIYDVAGDVALTRGSRGMPTTVVFDLDGRVAGHVTGELTRTSLASLLAAVAE